MVPFFSFHSRCGPSSGRNSCCSGAVCGDSTVLQTQYVAICLCVEAAGMAFTVCACMVSHGPNVKCRTVEGTQ